MRAIRSIRSRLAVALALVALLAAAGGAASLWVAGEVHSGLLRSSTGPTPLT